MRATEAFFPTQRNGRSRPPISVGHLCSLRKQTQVKRDDQRGGEAGNCTPVATWQTRAPRGRGALLSSRVDPHRALTALCDRRLQNRVGGRSEGNASRPPPLSTVFHNLLTVRGQQPGGCGLGTSPPPASPPPAYLQTQLERGHLRLASFPASIVPTATPHTPSTTLPTRCLCSPRGRPGSPETRARVDVP